jgi:hypothetical protein
LQYSEDDIRRCLNEHNQREERVQQLEEMQEFLGTDVLSWIPNNEHNEKSKALIQKIKGGLLEHSEGELEEIAVRDRFPFGGHDEAI